ncbi:DUF2490 domain-containing protein [bacterium]|nr:DUF2490 domain-containing protein [bacterium]
MRTGFPLLFLIIIPQLLFSQKKSYQQPALWSAFIVKKKVNDQFYLHNELRYRLIEKLNNPMQFVLRPSAHYTPKKWIDVSLGYTFSHGFPYAPHLTFKGQNENQLFEQLTLRAEKGHWRADSRMRYENRWIRTKSGNDVSQKQANRYRHQLALHYKAGKYSFTLYNEYFVISKTKGLRLHQNWTGFDVGRKLGEHTTASAGLMQWYLYRSETLYEWNHVLRLALRLDL